MRFLQNTVLNAGVLGTSFTSAAIDASYLITISAIATISNTSTNGVVKFQASNDSAISAPVNWVDIPSATVTLTSAGSYIIPKTDLSYQWIRIVYTNGGGSGVITINYKALGM
jgi:hypothetical protein